MDTIAGHQQPCLQTMPLESIIFLRLPPSLRAWLTAGASLSASPRLRYDEWRQNTQGLEESKEAPLPVSFCLGPNASKAVTLRANEPLRLSCIAGRIWFTKDRDIEDYLLSAGESAEVRNAAVVVFALQSSLIRVAQVTPSSLP